MSKFLSLTRNKRLAKQLTHQIVKSIRGKKIVTLSTQELDVQVFDISEEGFIGTEPDHKRFFSTF